MNAPVALITGAARGIGRGIALELARHGFDIIGCATKADPANTESGLYEVKPLIETMGRRFLPVAGDIADCDRHEAMVQQAVEAFGAIDVLVNNAGVAPLVRLDLMEATQESYDRVMGINLRGPFFFTQTVAKQMIAQSGRPHTPCIIFITSISSYAAGPNRVEYCLSKAGLSMTAQSYAVRLAEHGINVYDVRPGVITTDMTAKVQEKYDKLIKEGMLVQPRWGTPEDVGKACAALATGYFPYSTGAVFEVDGGFKLHRL